MGANIFHRRPHLEHALVWLLAVATVPVFADDLVSDGPLASGLTSSTMVKPNIGFIFDDSGSMDEENMPDGDGTNKSKRCWGWYKYNTLFYNPNYTYKPPYKPDGVEYGDGVRRFPDSVFTAALKDGYFPQGGYTYGGDDNSNTTTNLSKTANLSASVCSGSIFFGQCYGSSTKYYYSKRTKNTDENSCGDDGDYQIVTSASNIEAPGVETGSEAAKTNYANWYSYYRNRAMMMKAATAEAFGGIDDGKYRIGLFFLNSQQSRSNDTTWHPNSDLPIAEFSDLEESTHRTDFFDTLYGARSAGSTPLRGALSRMGRMYAGKISGWDPVQYSCQQNFTILSTDGYWNTDYETDTYGPKRVDGTTDVGNQDGGAVDPSPAMATIETDGNFNKERCYRPVSIRVTRAGEIYNLIDEPRAGSCKKNADDFGEWVRKLINDKTGTTGFHASYSSKSDTVTIYAPIEWGDFTETPRVVFEKVSGNGSESFTISSFGRFEEGSSGAPRPYHDASNAENTLADIAYYYYKTDLRTEGLNNCTNTIGDLTYSGLCENNVKGNGKDTAANQHMTTFTIGLGVSGTIEYESNYESARNVVGKSQYADILAGSAEWPEPTSDKKKIDDLWHAAVNGRGTYYSAKDATTLRDGIQDALNGIQARRGASAAAATSNLEPVAGDNNVYVAMYQTVKWDGDLVSFSIDPTTGALSGDPKWSAQEKLDKQFEDGVGERKIKYFSTSAESGNLKEFEEGNLTTDGLGVWFQNLCEKEEPPAQCEGMSETRLKAANSAENLVNYLRGDKSKEVDANNAEDNQLYRMREHLLGDIVNAVPVYMSKPPFSFDKLDATYGTFKTNNASRAPTVFVAANDGMLHAINADQGTERWAYVPTEVMENMWRLADSDYSDKHRYFVDGSPTIADVCTELAATDASKCKAAGNWKTILVGGLNKGGCGYYALDVTDPANPKGLWEFTDPNMGYTFGNPIIAKNAAGRWVAIVTSGYDNRPGGCKDTGDGQGHVFILDAYTGEKLADIVTTGSGGTATNPSNLGRLNAWIEDARNPTADRLYGGDLLGNVWRIDFDGNYSQTEEGRSIPPAMLLARLKDDGNKPQPISIKPELAVVGSTPIVLVGTGRYLGTSDLHDKSQQSLYALKDKLTDTGISDVRGEKMLERTLSETVGEHGDLEGRIIRTLSGAKMNWSTYDGWYFDFNPNSKSPGERVNVDMTLQYNLLTVAANVPAVSACDVGGYAYLYFVDINTGLNAPSAKEGMAGKRLPGNALVAGIKTVKLTDGRTVTIVTDTAGNVTSEDNPNMIGAGGTGARRAAWREIVD